MAFCSHNPGTMPLGCSPSGGRNGPLQPAGSTPRGVPRFGTVGARTGTPRAHLDEGQEHPRE
eukprot:15439052-Alexandrium_andersonii.AAC.1